MSENLKIAGTEDSPEIEMNNEAGEIVISGRSLPEDAFSFYEPVLNWISDYQKHPKGSTNFVFKLEYFNTASAKQIFKIISMAGELLKGGQTIFIKWHYDEGDKDMHSSGERFSKLTNLQFEFIQGR